MKKLFLFLALGSSIVFTSCNKDDDDKASSCSTCDLDVLGTVTSSKYCDNGDGTISVTTQGTTQTVELDGVSFDTFISQLDLVADCK